MYKWPSTLLCPVSLHLWDYPSILSTSANFDVLLTKDITWKQIQLMSAVNWARQLRSCWHLSKVMPCLPVGSTVLMALGSTPSLSKIRQIRNIRMLEKAYIKVSKIFLVLCQKKKQCFVQKAFNQSSFSNGIKGLTNLLHSWKKNFFSRPSIILELGYGVFK